MERRFVVYCQLRLQIRIYMNQIICFFFLISKYSFVFRRLSLDHDQI